MLGQSKKNKRIRPVHKAVALAFALTYLTGCALLEPGPQPEPTEKEIIEKYNAYWGSTDEQGNTGWCSQYPIPSAEYEIMKDCANATPERTAEGANCQ